MTDMPPFLIAKDEEKSGQGDSDSDVDDWDLPLSYDQPRHLEPIKGAERVEHSWRVKEKVGDAAGSAAAAVRRSARLRNAPRDENKHTWSSCVATVPHFRIHINIYCVISLQRTSFVKKCAYMVFSCNKRIFYYKNNLRLLMPLYVHL